MLFPEHTLVRSDVERASIAALHNALSVAFGCACVIGLEGAGAVHARGLGVHVVAPDEVPMARALGPGIGGFLAGLHREQGVVFHLRATAKGFDGSVLPLEAGTTIAADMLVVSVGVSPRTQLAAAAGLAVDNGILGVATTPTSGVGIFAAGGLA